MNKPTIVKQFHFIGKKPCLLNNKLNCEYLQTMPPPPKKNDNKKTQKKIKKNKTKHYIIRLKLDHLFNIQKIAYLTITLFDLCPLPLIRTVRHLSDTLVPHNSETKANATVGGCYSDKDFKYIMSLVIAV